MKWDPSGPHAPPGGLESRRERTYSSLRAALHPPPLFISRGAECDMFVDGEKKTCAA